MNPYLESLLGFVANLVIVFVIVRFIYYPRNRDRNFIFAFFALNTIVYFVMGLLSDLNISIGVGFGLFAIFSILRYRTSTIPIREMTYLFILIALPVLNSILVTSDSIPRFVVTNLATIAVLYVLEKEWGFQYETSKTITYDRIEMIRPENWNLLLADLRERTGLPIKRIDIGRLDLLRDTAEVTIYYDASELNTSVVNFSASESVYAAYDNYRD